MSIERKHIIIVGVFTIFVVLLLSQYTGSDENNVISINELSNNQTQVALQNEIMELKESKKEFQQYMIETKAELEKIRQSLISKAKIDSTNSQQSNESNSQNNIVMDYQRDSEVNSINEIEKQQQLETETKLVFSTVDENITNEVIDSDWSTLALDQLTNSFHTSELANLEIVDMECRSTMCKMSLTIPSPESQGDTLDKISASMPWPGETLMEVSADGSNILIYLSREGHDLTPSTAMQSDDSLTSKDPG